MPMIELIRNLLTNLGLNVAGVPDLIIVLGTIVVLIVVLRILHEVLDTLLSIGCIVIGIIFVAWLLLEVFR